MDTYTIKQMYYCTAEYDIWTFSTCSMYQCVTSNLRYINNVYVVYIPNEMIFKLSYSPMQNVVLRKGDALQVTCHCYCRLGRHNSSQSGNLQHSWSNVYQLNWSGKKGSLEHSLREPTGNYQRL